MPFIVSIVWLTNFLYLKVNSQIVHDSYIFQKALHTVYLYFGIFHHSNKQYYYGMVLNQQIMYQEHIFQIFHYSIL